jgi:hypothetical protein
MDEGVWRSESLAGRVCWQAVVEAAARARANGSQSPSALVARVRAVAASASAQGLDLLLLIDTSKEAYDLVESVCGYDAD